MFAVCESVCQKENQEADMRINKYTEREREEERRDHVLKKGMAVY